MSRPEDINKEEQATSEQIRAYGMPSGDMTDNQTEYISVDEVEDMEDQEEMVDTDEEMSSSRPTLKEVIEENAREDEKPLEMIEKAKVRKPIIWFAFPIPPTAVSE